MTQRSVLHGPCTRWSELVQVVRECSLQYMVRSKLPVMKISPTRYDLTRCDTRVTVKLEETYGLRFCEINAKCSWKSFFIHRIADEYTSSKFVLPLAWPWQACHTLSSHLCHQLFFRLKILLIEQQLLVETVIFLFFEILNLLSM